MKKAILGKKLGMTQIFTPEGLVVPVTVVDACDYENNTFEYTKIVIPGSVKTIKAYGFAKCINLTELVIPRGVQTVGEYAFLGCVKLRSFMTYSCDVFFPNRPLSLGTVYDYAFFRCDELQIVVLPDTVTAICEVAFAFCKNLESLHLPTTLGTIGRWAFRGCERLKTIELPDSVFLVEEEAFLKCPSLKTIKCSNPGALSTAKLRKGIKII